MIPRPRRGSTDDRSRAQIPRRHRPSGAWGASAKRCANRGVAHRQGGACVGLTGRDPDRRAGCRWCPTAPKAPSRGKPHRAAPRFGPTLSQRPTPRLHPRRPAASVVQRRLLQSSLRPPRPNRRRSSDLVVGRVQDRTKPSRGDILLGFGRALPGQPHPLLSRSRRRRLCQSL